jgi:UDP-N-acetylglucosamine 4,6-dehydratase
VNGTVLITGGTGSLGQAILSRAKAERWDARFVVYSRDEAKQAVLQERFPGVRCILGDVRDAERLEAAMRGVDTVIHAAAYKRVPEAERQPITCAESNVEGSANVVAAARRIGTPRVIGISTDKACSPINAYGFTKALMERMFAAEALERPDGPAFTIVRYGNVIASRGSVVPMFRAQAAKGGPLTLTDPDMTRFWLTLDDAVDLILAGLAIPSGHILVPKSRSSSMRVMAEASAPGVPTVTGVNRGGEKKHEQLMNRHESPYASQAPVGFILAPMAGAPVGWLEPDVEYTSDKAKQYSVDELRMVLALMDADETVRTLRAA